MFEFLGGINFNGVFGGGREENALAFDVGGQVLQLSVEAGQHDVIQRFQRPVGAMRKNMNLQKNEERGKKERRTHSPMLLEAAFFHFTSTSGTERHVTKCDFQLRTIPLRPRSGPRSARSARSASAIFNFVPCLSVPEVPPKCPKCPEVPEVPAKCPKCPRSAPKCPPEVVPKWFRSGSEVGPVRFSTSYHVSPSPKWTKWKWVRSGCCYSCRRAVMGSMREARRAGT
jgi:hypothetical protein